MLTLAILWFMFTIPVCIIQLQLASLKKSKQKNDQAIDTLQLYSSGVYFSTLELSLGVV